MSAQSLLLVLHCRVHHGKVANTDIGLTHAVQLQEGVTETLALRLPMLSSLHFNSDHKASLPQFRNMAASSAFCAA